MKLNYKLLGLLLIISSVVSICETEYFVVLKKPLPVQNERLVSTIAQKNPMQFIDSQHFEIFSNVAIQRILLFSTYKKGLTSQGYALSLSDSNEEYTYLIKVSDEFINEFVRSVKALDSYIHVQKNFTYTTFQTATDEPQYSNYQKTSMEFMKLPDVWSTSSGAGIRIAVLDTGIYLNHREFCDGLATVDAGNQTMTLNSCTKVVAPFDFIDDASPALMSGLLAVDGGDYEDIDTAPIDKDGHGSHVAGIIGANLNNFGIIGVAYNAAIIPIRVLAPYKKCDSCSVVSSGQTSHIIKGINYAVTNNADIINLSLGGVLVSDEDFLFQQAVDSATAAGALIVAAAGNSNLNFDNSRVAPAYYSNALSVGSTTATGEKSTFSNYGQTLDVSAFGGQANGAGCIESESVYSVGLLSNTAIVSNCGTSMSAPFVSGLAANIKSYYKTTENKTLKPAEIRRLIQISASADAKSLSYGYGTINGRKSMVLSGVALFDSESSDVYISDTGNNDLLVCYPNPLYINQSSSTACNFFLNKAASYQYWIFSRRGKIIKTASVASSQGKQTVSWDGTDRNMAPVPNGVYQMVLKLNSTVDSQQITKKHLITLFR